MIERIKKILSSNETYAGTCEEWDISSLLQIVIEILKEKKEVSVGKFQRKKWMLLQRCFFRISSHSFGRRREKRCLKNGKRNRRKRRIEGCNLCKILLG